MAEESGWNGLMVVHVVVTRSEAVVEDGGHSIQQTDVTIVVKPVIMLMTVTFITEGTREGIICWMTCIWHLVDVLLSNWHLVDNNLAFIINGEAYLVRDKRKMLFWQKVITSSLMMR